MVRPSKPDRIAWVPVGIEPDGAKKTLGHVASELDKPTDDQFNWYWNKGSDIQDFLYGAVERNIIIGSDANEADYPTFALYLADSPAAGDRVLIRESQTSSVQIIIPDSIAIQLLKGSKFIFDTAIATSCLEIGDNVTIVGELLIDVTNAGGTQAKVINFNGDNSKIDFCQIDKTQAGSTITDAVAIAAAKDNNVGNFIVTKSGGGTITNYLTDSSATFTNLIEVSNETIILRSNGSKDFSNGITFNLGSDVNGDTYHRAAGALARLAIGATSTISQVVGGLPAWVAIKDALLFGSDVNGDTIYRDSGEYKRLAIGATGAIWQVVAGLPSWTAIKNAIFFGSDADGDMIYRDSGEYKRLPKGADRQTLELASGVPVWGDKGSGAYYNDIFAVQNTWYVLSGDDATAINWRDKRIAIWVEEIQDGSDWINLGVDSQLWLGTLPAAGTARSILTGGANSFELRANSGTGNIEGRRTSAGGTGLSCVVKLLNDS